MKFVRRHTVANTSYDEYRLPIPSCRTVETKRWIQTRVRIQRAPFKSDETILRAELPQLPTKLHRTVNYYYYC